MLAKTEDEIFTTLHTEQSLVTEQSKHINITGSELFIMYSEQLQVTD